VIPDSTCGIPSIAAAYSLTWPWFPKTLGYVTVWPAGQTQPVVATMNSPDGRIKSNAAIVAAGSQGAVSVFATDETDVILDINGYFVPAGAAGPGLLVQSTRSLPIPKSNCGVPVTARFPFSARTRRI